MNINERAELFNKTQVELVDEIIQLHAQLETARNLVDRARNVLELYAKAGSASPLPARSVLAAIRAMKPEQITRPHANDCDCATCIRERIEADKKGGLVACKRCGRHFAPGTGHSC